jgi:hypothetical protein
MTVLVGFVGAGITLAVLAALVPVLTELRQHQRARAAADAAALAGVVAGRRAAAELAAANGGVLVEWTALGDEITVVVLVGDQRATARATDAP